LVVAYKDTEGDVKISEYVPTWCTWIKLIFPKL
jgi:hypothetical protein